MALADTDSTRDALASAGISPASIAAVMRIDELMQAWRRRMTKRELGQKAIKALGIGLDLAQVDVLMAVAAPAGGDAGEVMVQTVAERLAIDPSRASRLVAEVVEAGYARRVASQGDARRTLLELTVSGEAVVNGVRMFKYLHLGDFLDGWTPAELATFVPLLERFSDWSDRNPQDPHRFDAELTDLAARIDRTLPAL